MALFPQFPYSNLHELNLDWLIDQLRNGTVISVNGMSGIVTLYTEKDVVFPDRALDPDWSVYRRIAEKHAGLKFTGEKFYYITKNVDDKNFTIQEVYTSSNLPPFPVTSVNGQTGNVIISIPVTSVNGHTGTVVLAGDNIPYNIDGTYTIEDVIIPLEKSIGHVIRGNTCSEGVSAGQYVYLILSTVSGRDDGLYKAVNAKSAGTVWTSADLEPVAGGLGALMASNDTAISQLNSKLTTQVDPAGATFLIPSLIHKTGEVVTIDIAYVLPTQAIPADTDTLIGTLSSDFRPNRSVWSSLVLTSESGEIQATPRILVDRDGTVKMKAKNGIPVVHLFGTFTYIM